MLYAIRTTNGWYTKFGVSVDVDARLRDLQCACPLDLEVICFADWPNETERQVHKYLEHQHVRGEWFEDSFRTQWVIETMSEPNGLEVFTKAFNAYQDDKNKQTNREYLIHKAQWRRQERADWWKNKEAA